MRTVLERVYDALPRGDFRVLESYVRALRSAECLVHLESQFLWSPDDEDLARATRLRLWREHLERDDVGGESVEHRLSCLPHVSRRTRAFLGPVNGLLVDG